jgi:ClpP class serine protease
MAIDPSQFSIDPKSATKEDIAEALRLLEAKKVRDARIEAGEIKGTYTKPYSEYTEEEKERAREYNRRRLARQTLLVNKAIAAGLSVSDAEIDEYIAKKQGGASSEPQEA